MPDISISDSNFERLQRLAKPFVDTPDTVIGRLLDQAEASGGTPAVQANGHASSLRRLDADAPDDLSFTRVRNASFAGVDISRPNWNKLVRVVHTKTKKQLGSFRDLRAITIANVQEGKNEDYGFSYVPESDISIQGLASNQAWQCCLKLARHLGVSIRVEVEWHARSDAAHPGERGLLEWKPKA